MNACGLAKPTADAVPRAFRSEAPKRIDHLVGSLGHTEFKAVDPH